MGDCLCCCFGTPPVYPQASFEEPEDASQNPPVLLLSQPSATIIPTADESETDMEMEMDINPLDARPIDSSQELQKEIYTL